MRPVKNLLILFLLILSGCSATREAGVAAKTSYDNLKIEARNEYSKGQVVELRVHNTSKNDTLILYKPLNMKVQKKQEDQWKRVRTLYCPCGASCPAPPERVSVLPGSAYTYRWDQKEQWCGEMNQQGIPEMHSKFSGPGQYRIAIRYVSAQNQNIRSVYKSFTIK